MKTLTALLTVLILSSAVSFAGDKAKHSPAEKFKKVDTNNDDKLSLEELKASPKGQKNPDKVDGFFKKADTDANGSLSLAEFEAAHADHAKGKGKGKGKGKK